jgi:hypothetical protein
MAELQEPLKTHANYVVRITKETDLVIFTVDRFVRCPRQNYGDRVESICKFVLVFVN